MEKKIISTSNAGGIGIYSQGVQVHHTYYFSGQIGLNPETKEMGKDFLAQLLQIFSNIDALLAASHLQRENIVKTTVFLQDMKDFDLLNQEYKKYFANPYPARSCVQVARLPKDALVEIECIASSL